MKDVNMSTSSKTFDRAVRTVVLEKLRSHGFSFDGSRTFRRSVGDSAIRHIINFQLGQRSLEGKFAVNLGVYVPGDAAAHIPDLEPRKAMEFHCAPERRERLGRLLPRRLQALQDVPFIGMLFGPKDVWWRFSADQEATVASLSTVLAAIETYGLPWLDRMTPNPFYIDSLQSARN